MDKIIFEVLSIEGFGSYQLREDIDINRPGINLIKAPNGKGKTTIWNAIYFCLFGEDMKKRTLDKLPTWEHKRIDDFKGTRIITHFIKGEDTYQVIRHINYSGETLERKGGDKLMLRINGELHGEDRDKADVQRHIIEILGATAKVFMNSIIFGQRMTRIITAKAEDKRKLLEDIFELSFIPAAKKRALAKKTTLQTSITVESNIRDGYSRDLDRMKEDISQKEEQFNNFESEKAKDSERVQGQIDTHTVSIGELNTKISDTKKELKKYKPKDTTELSDERDEIYKLLEGCHVEFNKLNRDVSDCVGESEKSDKKKVELEDHKANPTTDCYACGQNLPKAEVAKAHKKLLEDIKTEEEIIVTMADTVKLSQVQIGKLEKETKKKQDLYDKKVEEITAQTDIRVKKNNLEGVLSTHQANLDNAQDNRKRAKTDLKVIQDRRSVSYDFEALGDALDGIRNKVSSTQEKIEAYEEELNYINYWNNKGYGTDGLKALVFDAMLLQLNEIIKKYAERLGIQVEFSVDMSKVNKPFLTKVTMEGHEVDYIDLSGGQAQRVDICLAFAMFDLVNSSGAFNILVLDEIMEGLDEEGIEQVFELVRSKAEQGGSIYIISHLANVDTKHAKVISIEYDGVTSRVV